MLIGGVFNTRQKYSSISSYWEQPISFDPPNVSGEENEYNKLLCEGAQQGVERQAVLLRILR